MSVDWIICILFVYCEFEVITGCLELG